MANESEGDFFYDANFFNPNDTECNSSDNFCHFERNDSRDVLPPDMQFNDSHVIAIVTYSALMILSAVGNFTVLISLCQKQKQRRSRVNLLLIHLAVSDLMVTFFLMPLEVAWSSTVSWWADDLTCRFTAFIRIIGLYMSSFILICISIDRWFAILRPLSVRNADERTKLMLIVAWAAGVFCSLPQVFLFHVESHPKFTWFRQCVVFNSYPSPNYELAYNLFCMMAMYGFPLIVIVVTYGSIIFEINKKTRHCIEANGNCKEISLRRSGPQTLTRARSKTLRMTLIMVTVFIMCWTPYYCLCLWYWFDRQTARNLDQRIQKTLFLFACSNSCMNPIVYGIFMAKCGCRNAREKKDCFDDWIETVTMFKH